MYKRVVVISITFSQSFVYNARANIIVGESVKYKLAAGVVRDVGYLTQIA